MNLTITEQDLAAIEEMAAHGFSIEEIAEVITEPDFTHEPCPMWKYHAFIENYRECGLVKSAYRKGFLKSQLELRQRIFIDAKHGSSPAQSLAKNILDAAAYKNEWK